MSLGPSSPPRPRASALQASGARVWSLSPRDHRALLRVLFALLVPRLILYVTGAFAIRILPPHVEPQVQISLGKNLSLAAWVRWDSAWYLSVAERGYWFDPAGPSNVAFFPLFPLLIKGVGVLTGNLYAAGLLVANVAALGAFLAFWSWVRTEAGGAAAERATLWLLVFPFSFFFHSVYAESLFFLLTTLSLQAHARGHRLTSGMLGGLAATTRPMGVLLAPAFAWGL